MLPFYLSLHSKLLILNDCYFFIQGQLPSSVISRGQSCTGTRTSPTFVASTWPHLASVTVSVSTANVSQCPSPSPGDRLPYLRYSSRRKIEGCCLIKLQILFSPVVSYIEKLDICVLYLCVWVFLVLSSALPAWQTSRYSPAHHPKLCQCGWLCLGPLWHT